MRRSLQLASQGEASKLAQGFEEFRKRTENQLANYSTQVKAAAGEAASSATKAIEHSLWMAEYENTKFRAEYFASKNEGYNAFQAWVEHMEVVDALGWLDDERWAGRNIQRVLEALPKANAVSYQLQTKLFKLLEKTPAILASDVERLKKAVEAKERI